MAESIVPISPNNLPPLPPAKGNIASLVNPDTINSQEFRNYVANDKWEITAKKILNNVWRLRGAYLFH